MAQKADLAAKRAVTVLGAGIAGLYAAEHLTRAGHRVTVVERSRQCGGAHRSANIGPYTFDIGSIFYERNALIFHLAKGLIDKCPNVLRQQRRIAPDGALLHYPLAPREVLRTRPWRVPLGVMDMLASRLLVRQDGTLDAISRKRLGSIFFRDTGLRAYISRFNHVPPEDIDEQFFFRRMGFIEQATRLANLAKVATRLIYSDSGFKTPRKPLYVRPQGGFGELFDPIRERLEAAGVKFHFLEDITAIEQIGSGFRLQGTSQQFQADCVVSTISLSALYAMLFGESPGLASLDMTTLFVSAEKFATRAGNVLFNFHDQGHWKRATIYSRIYAGTDTDREFLGVEVTIPPGGKHDPEAMFADFRDHLTRLGLAQDLRLEGSAFNEAAYPLYLKGSDVRLDAALARVHETGIISVGRQGRFEYLPTSTGVIARVGEELDKAFTASRLEAQAS